MPIKGAFRVAAALLSRKFGFHLVEFIDRESMAFGKLCLDFLSLGSDLGYLGLDKLAFRPHQVSLGLAIFLFGTFEHASKAYSPLPNFRGKRWSKVDQFSSRSAASRFQIRLQYLENFQNRQKRVANHTQPKTFVRVF
jgi:hypothetical protein